MLEKGDISHSIPLNVSRRQVERDMSRKIPVSVTLEKELHDMIEDMVDRKIFKDRTHAINASLDYLRWTLKNDPMKFYGPRSQSQNQQPPQQQKNDNQYYPH